MKTYSDDNPPKSGNAKKIYNALKANGWIVKDLHYNPNCWGQSSGSNGWGTWACEIWGAEYPSESRHILYETEFFCGVKDGEVYLQYVGSGFIAWSITK